MQAILSYTIKPAGDFARAWLIWLGADRLRGTARAAGK